VRRFRADLHIHTALSPCASDEMTPPAIVKAAADEGLRMIAVCDHNTSGNAAAVQRAAGGDLAVIAGMEVTTAEEVHVLGLFPHADAAAAAAGEVKATLPDVGEGRRMLGGQTLMDERGNTVGTEAKLLADASGFALSEAVEMIRRHDGLVVASHVDRPSFGLIGQLGIFPEDVRFDAVELTKVGPMAAQSHALLPPGVAVVASSDAHFLEDVGLRWTELEMEEATFAELRLALAGEGGRECSVA